MGIAKPLGKLEWKLLGGEVIQRIKAEGGQKGAMMVREWSDNGGKNHSKASTDTTAA